MRTSQRLIHPVLFLILWSPVGTTVAQPPASPPASANNLPRQPADVSPSAVQQAELETFYLEDQNGKLIPFFNMPFEEFEEVYKLYKKLKAPEEQPRYVLQELMLDGTANGGQVEFDMLVKILALADGWIRVPLRFKDVIVKPADSEPQPNGQFLEYDDESDGFICWIQAKPDKTYTVKMTGITKTRVVAGKTLLALDVARATVSQLRLRVEGHPVHVEVSHDSVLQRMQPAGNGQTDLTILGLNGPVEVSWQSITQSTVEPSPPLHATGNVLVKVVSESKISCEVGIQVQSSRTMIDSFIVRLPQEMKLRPFVQPGYSVRELEPSERVRFDTSDRGQLVEVKLDQPTSGPEEIRLNAEMQRTNASADSPVEIGGFEVLGTPFQSGYFNLAVENDWMVSASEGANIRRVEAISDSLRRAGVVARFAYDGQPCSLKVQTFPKQQRVTIEPQYRIYVEPDEVRLEAKLICKLRGAKADSIRIDMAGWEVDDIEESEFVDSRTIRFDRESPLVINLAPSAASLGGQFDLTVLAHRTADEPTRLSQTWTLTLPRPEASALAPATVIVFAASNVALSPIEDAIRGLVPDAPASQTLAPLEPQPAFSYRELGDTAASIFATRFEIRKQTVSVTEVAAVRVLEHDVHMQQRLTYRIEYEPLTHVFWDVPRDLITSPSFHIQLDDKSPPWEELTETPEGEAAVDWTRLRVDLLGNRIGICDLLVEYSIPLVDRSPPHEDFVHLPLVRPVVAEPTRVAFDRLQVTIDERFHLEPQTESWKTDDEAYLLDQQFTAYRFTAEQVPDHVPLKIAAREVSYRRSTVVQTAWVQTSLSSVSRQDRAAFRLTTSESRLRIKIPEGAILDKASLDSRELTNVSLQESGEIPIDLVSGSELRQYVVEVWYSFRDTRSPAGVYRMELPRVLDARWTRRFYWQLVLPPEEYLLWAPRNVIAELGWVWHGSYWERRPSLSQHDLERLTGATHQPAVSDANHQYVFSAFGDMDAVAFTTASRRNIMLGVSIASFVAGLLLIYFPILRGPVPLLVLGIVLTLGGLFYPEPALQIAQIASLGIVFVVAAQLLKLALVRPRPGRGIIRGTSRTGVDSTITEAMPVPTESSSHASTANGSFSMQANVSD